MEAERIAVVKTGWCETYDGDLVGGAHASIAEFDEGHERYNFRKCENGVYYGYTPPIGETEAPPSPKVLTNWLVFFVAKKPGEPGIYLVGWYEGADFAGGYPDRPEYASKPPTLELDVHGGRFTFTVSAPAATLIPSTARQFKFRGDHMKRTSISYLRGNGETGAWREELAKSLLKAKVSFEEVDEEAKAASPINRRGGICGDSEQRRKVEQAAIECVKKHFGTDYDFVDRQKDNCGFDLLFTHKFTLKEHHVEVKGTAQTAPHFFMSSNEFAYALKSESWQLAMVTEALKGPKLIMMNYAAAKKVFDWQTFTWHAVAKTN